MSSLELLDRFVEVDDAVQEGKYLGGEGGYIAHCPVVGVEEGEKDVHPARVDEGPGYEGKEGDLFSLSLEMREKINCVWLTVNDSEQSE